MPTESDRDRAAAFLLATGREQAAADIEKLAELLATVRTEELERVIDWSEGYFGVDQPEGFRREMFEKGAELLRAGDHRPDPTADAPHAGECARCHAPFIRTPTGAVPSCGCHETK